jgi:hypothetical protein
MLDCGVASSLAIAATVTHLWLIPSITLLSNMIFWYGKSPWSSPGIHEVIFKSIGEVSTEKKIPVGRVVGFRSTTVRSRAAFRVAGAQPRPVPMLH